LRISLFLIVLMFLSCSKQVSIGKKAFDKEDEYILKALMYEEKGDYKDAIKTYSYLYEKSKKSVYYQKIVALLFYQKKYDEVIKKANEFLKHTFDKEVFKYEIFALLKKKKFKKAKELLLNKFNKKDEFYYSVMSYILLQEGKVNEAVYYLKSLYALKPTKKNLLKLADALIEAKKYNEALAYLRTHLNLYGCELDICKRMAVIYKSLYDYENLALIYSKMAKISPRYYILALNAYIQNKDYKKAEEFIKKNRLDETLLMFLYATEHKFKKAAYTALKLYEKRGDLKYLLKYCEYLYYSHPNKKEAEDIANKLKFLVKLYPDAYLYNFLGYLLIDYDINPKEGIEYVQRAIEIDPQNQEYIDSLAWGYYKLGKCKEAYEIIKGISLKDAEIQKHKKAIKKCLKEEDDSSKNNPKNKRGLGKNKIPKTNK